MASAPRRSPTRSANEPAARERTVAHGRLGLDQLGAADLALGLEAGGLAFGVFEGHQAGGTLGAVGHDGAEILAVLPSQLRQQAAALLHVDEPLGVVLPPLDLVTQRARHIGQLDGGGEQAVVVALERPAPRQQGAGPAEQVQGPAVAGGVQQVKRLEGRIAVGGRVGQAVLFQAE